MVDKPFVGSFVRLTGPIEVEGTLSAVRIPDEDNEEVSVVELDVDAAFKADKSQCPLRDSEEAYPELVSDEAGIFSLKVVNPDDCEDLETVEGELKLLWLDLLFCERWLAPFGDADSDNLGILMII